MRISPLGSQDSVPGIAFREKVTVDRVNVLHMTKEIDPDKIRDGMLRWIALPRPIIRQLDQAPFYNKVTKKRGRKHG